MNKILHFVIVSLFSISSLYAQNIPAGFTLKKITDLIKGPTTMAVAPDGRIFICRQGGEVRVVKNDVLLATPAIKITVDSVNERGLIGIAFDPSFTTNQYVYLYHTLPNTVSPRLNRISRYTVVGDIINPASQVTILNLDNLTAKTNHNGGAMSFGPDGKLYVAVGNNNDDGGSSSFTNPNSQNLDTHHGKLLRINSDGSVPTGNPFTTGTAQKMRIWSYGLRNPYSIDVHPTTGKIYVNDVGNKAFEEIDDVTTGGQNFGWPLVEGTAGNPLYVDPVFAYQNVSLSPVSGDGVGCAITGGVFFSPATTKYPSTYNNKYFYLDWCNGWINYIDHTVASPTANAFATNLPVTPGSPYIYPSNPSRNVILKVGSDGSLYFLNGAQYGGTVMGALYKIEYTNNYPTVSISEPTDNSNVCQGAAITITASANDADGTISKVEFYDGATLLSTVTSSPYTYNWSGAALGAHTITAKATDNLGVSTTSAIITVTVNAFPSAPTVTSPVTNCQNTTATALTATGSNLKWYTVATLGTASATAPTPTTTASGTTNHYVSQTVSSCEGARALIAVNVTALPAAPTVTTPVTYCQNATATALTATGSNLLWYTVATLGTGSATAPTPTTTASGTTNHYVSQTVSSCEGPRALIAVNVTALPAAPTVTTPVTYCQNATATALTATGSNLKWYTVATLGTASATAPTPVTTASGTTNHYVSQTVSSCEGPRALIAVNVTALPAAPTVTTPITYCQNATATALTATGSNLKWYTVATLGTGSATAPTPTTTASGTTNHYVSQTVSSCEGPRALIAVNITALPAAPTVTTPVTYCQNATATALAATGSNLKWYTVATLGTASATAPTPTTTASGSTNHYVSQTVSSCEGPRATIAVNVTALPAAPTVTTPVTYCQNATASALAATGSNLKWYTVATLGTGSSTAPTPTTTSSGTTNHYVSQTVSSCEGPRATIAVTVNALPTATITPGGPTTFNQGGNVVLSANTGTGLAYKWLNGPAQVGNNDTYTATVGGNYTVEITNSSTCKKTSAITVVTVNGNQAPTVGITSPTNNTTFGVPATITINATANDVDGTISKVDFYYGTTLIGTANNVPYSVVWSGVPTGTHSLTAVATDNLGAIGTSTAVTVIVNNQPSVITITSPANNATITGTSVNITVNATDPDGSITKVEYFDGATLIGTNTAQPYSFTWSNPAVGTHSITVKVTDSNGGVTTSSATTFTISSPTSIISASNYGTFTNVYPNPASDAFTIKSSKQIKNLWVINMYGIEVLNLQDIPADQLVEIGKDLEDGTYFLLIKDASDKMETAKLIKIK